MANKLQVANIATKEVVEISNGVIRNGVAYYLSKSEPKGKWCEKYHVKVIGHEDAGAYTKYLLDTEDGWNFIVPIRDGERKERKPRAKKAETKKAEPVTIETTDEPKAEAVEVVSETVSEPVVVDEPSKVAEAEDTTDETNEQALIAAIKNLRGGAVDMAKVREIVQEEFARLAAEDAKKAAKVLKSIAKVKGDANEVHCAKYDRILAKVSRGRRVYLHGPAGSGKSHTAEQIARDLGLDFYGQTTIQFAHDVRGYGDAGGKFQDTPFYKAFAFGGLYFQDEYDRSNAEAAIVLNSALANGWYDFPVIGRVEAHPNFRFMAAGNTLMKGADDGYITGQEIDPSSRDRFDFYFEVGYLREVELHIAHGNTEIVDFVEDVRQAIKSCGIEHVVSYRATAAMTDEVENENDLVSCCEEGIFKGLDVDARREIYAALQNKDCRWAKALKKTL